MRGAAVPMSRSVEGRLRGAVGVPELQPEQVVCASSANCGPHHCLVRVRIAPHWALFGAMRLPHGASKHHVQENSVSLSVVGTRYHFFRQNAISINSQVPASTERFLVKLVFWLCR